MKHLAIAIAVLVAVPLLARPAQGKSKKDASYPYERVWPAAVRFLRIDEGVDIVEKDGEVGYVIFDLHDEGKRFRGSLEIVKTRDRDGRAGVRLLLSLEDRPSYMELGILDRLVYKLRKELGSPAPAPPKKPKPKPEPEPDRPKNDRGRDRAK